MENIQDIMAIPSPYRGSEQTAAKVKEEIGRRWPELASSYDPKFTTRTYREWSKIGYRVKQGEKAIKSITIIEVKDDKGKVVKTYPKVINLFNINQIERMKS
jgi:hypothetical protein